MKRTSLLFITHSISYDWFSSSTFFYPIFLSLFKDQWNVGLMKYKSAYYTNIDLNETELPQEATLITQNSMNNVYKCITKLTSSSWDNGLNFKSPIWYLKRTLWVELTDLKFNVFFFHRKYQIKPKCYFMAYQKRNFFSKHYPKNIDVI